MACEFKNLLKIWKLKILENKIHGNISEQYNKEIVQVNLIITLSLGSIETDPVISETVL